LGVYPSGYLSLSVLAAGQISIELRLNLVESSALSIDLIPLGLVAVGTIWWGYLHSVKWLSKFPKENWYHECNLTETDVLIGKVRQSIAPNLAIKFESIDLLDLEDGVDVDRLARNVLWWRFINFCQKVDLASDIELVARNYGSIISCPLLFSLINI
jgi:hypothetical protein